jgi:hypothetical protein
MFPQEAKGSQHVSQIALCVIVITCNSERHVAFGVGVSLPTNSRPFPQAPLSPVRSGTRHTPAGALCRPSEALAQARAIGGDCEARGPLIWPPRFDRFRASTPVCGSIAAMTIEMLAATASYSAAFAAQSLSSHLARSGSRMKLESRMLVSDAASAGPGDQVLKVLPAPAARLCVIDRNSLRPTARRVDLTKMIQPGSRVEPFDERRLALCNVQLRTRRIDSSVLPAPHWHA